MIIKEKNILSKDEIPKYVYHLVPEDVFFSCLNSEGDYDCRDNQEWGAGSKIIHTSNSKKILKERVADWKWSTYPLKRNFFLLKIDMGFIKSKITYAVYGDIKYFHIHGALPEKSIHKEKARRFKNGKFDI